MVTGDVVFLEKDVRMIMLQFSFSNPNVIPSCVRRLNQETQDELLDRKSRSNGILVIKPTERCFLAGFIKDLNMSEYEIVDSFYKKRIDAKDSNGKNKYHTVRFLFARREFAEVSNDFKKVRPIISTELRKICETAMWRVRLFFNQFYKDGKDINGQYALSINLEARQPFYCPDGQPVTVWQKDEKGKRVGKSPLPLKAEYELRIKGYPHMENSAISLMTA